MSANNSILNYFVSTSQRSIHSYANEEWDEPKETDNSLSTQTTISSEPSSSTCSILKETDFDLYRQQCLQFAGEWGLHRFDKNPWSNSTRPTVSIRKRHGFILNDMERTGVLSDRIIASCSSYLTRSPEVQHYAFCKCVLRNKMISNIEIMKFHHYLQYVDLSWNELIDIEALGQLPFLMYLDVSHNFLETLLDFKAPLYLTFVNFSYNFVSDIRDLSEFWSLVHLDLSFNHIRTISSAFQTLKYLSYLNLSGNLIGSMENLNSLPIRKLFISHNKLYTAHILKDGINLTNFDFLTYINLSHNQMTSLRIFRKLNNLEILDASFNRISSLLELIYLRKNKFLTTLILKNNYIANINNYALACLMNCKNLLVLDDEEISTERRSRITMQTEYNPNFSAMRDRINLIMLQQLNEPQFNFGLVYGEAAPILLVLVGSPGSNKGKLVRKFCTMYEKFAVAAISHTTREKTPEEVDGEDYYFVKSEVFSEMLRNGSFATHSDFNEHRYGFAYTELQKSLDKGKDKVLVTHMNIDAAIVLRMRGLNPKLVLAIPSTTDKHFNILQTKYLFRFTPDGIKVARANILAEAKRFSVEPEIQLVQKVKEQVREDLTGDSCCGMKHQECRPDLNISTVKVQMMTDEQKMTGILKSDYNPHTKTHPNSVSFKVCDIEYTCVTLECSPTRKSIECHIPTSVFDDSCLSLTDYYVTDESMPNLKRKSALSSASQGVLSDESKNILSVLSFDMGTESVLNTFFNLVVDSENHKTFHKHFCRSLVLDYEKVADAIRQFLEVVYKMRTNLLEFHASNGGVLLDVIFTEDEETSLLQLKYILKDAIQNYKVIKTKSSLAKGRSYKNIVEKRLHLLKAEIRGNVAADPEKIICNCTKNASSLMVVHGRKCMEKMKKSV